MSGAARTVMVPTTTVRFFLFNVPVAYRYRCKNGLTHVGRRRILIRLVPRRGAWLKL
jgi:hypothetical protein